MTIRLPSNRRCSSVGGRRFDTEQLYAGVVPRLEPTTVAKQLLADELPERWLHVQGVGMKAVDLAPLLGSGQTQLLVDAAVLHDVGYSSQIRDTGFHPIDGARHLRRGGFDERIVNLVAHHTCARVEAGLRGLGHILDDEFPKDHALPHPELCYCDLTVNPIGEVVTVDERLADIRHRYGIGHVVHDFVDQAEPELRRSVADVEERMNAQPRYGESPSWAK